MRSERPTRPASATLTTTPSTGGSQPRSSNTPPSVEEVSSTASAVSQVVRAGALIGGLLR
jgi:hypothetical protein